MDLMGRKFDVEVNWQRLVVFREHEEQIVWKGEISLVGCEIRRWFGFLADF